MIESMISRRMEDYRVLQPEPNLTAILPGHCPAKCPFCVEPEHPKQAAPLDWLKSFEKLLEELPDLFAFLTISGGEPSMSPIFSEVLHRIEPHRRSGRLKRVVLTTNGSSKHLSDHLAAISRAVTHINISRHSVDDEINRQTFKTRSIPGAEGLKDLIWRFNQMGVPVNLNCVHSSKHVFGLDPRKVSLGELKGEAIRFIDFAKEMGASSVVFRGDHRENRLDGEVELENAFSDYTTVHESRCESCRVIGKLIRGIPINFKRSIFEPTQVHKENEIFELVFHSDGSLCRDWARNHYLHRPLPKSWPTPDPRSVTTSGSLIGLPSDCNNPVPGCGLLVYQDPNRI